MSSTILQVLMQKKEFEQELQTWILSFNPYKEGFSYRMFMRAGIQRRFPVTDDMKQMLEDLNITPVEWDDRHFKWQ